VGAGFVLWVPWQLRGGGRGGCARTAGDVRPKDSVHRQLVPAAFDARGHMTSGRQPGPDDGRAMPRISRHLGNGTTCMHGNDAGKPCWPCGGGSRAPTWRLFPPRASWPWPRPWPSSSCASRRPRSPAWPGLAPQHHPQGRTVSGPWALVVPSVLESRQPSAAARPCRGASLCLP